MPERKDRFALLSRYSKLHNTKYGEKPLLNLNVEQWAADAMIESYGIQFCYDLYNTTLMWHSLLTGNTLSIMHMRLLIKGHSLNKIY